MEKGSLIEYCFWGHSCGLVIPWARLFVLGRRLENCRLEGEIKVKAEEEKFLERSLPEETPQNYSYGRGAQATTFI